MKKLISELRELIDNKHRLNGMSNYAYADFDEKITEMESKISNEAKPKKYGKFVELMDGMDCCMIKRKNILKIAFRKENFTEVNFYMKNGDYEIFNVSENQEVIENLIADFKG